MTEPRPEIVALLADALTCDWSAAWRETQTGPNSFDGGWDHSALASLLLAHPRLAAALEVGLSWLDAVEATDVRPGWWLYGLRKHRPSVVSEAWKATSWDSIAREDGIGPTPGDALRSLAARLRGAPAMTTTATGLRDTVARAEATASITAERALAATPREGANEVLIGAQVAPEPAVRIRFGGHVTVALKPTEAAAVVFDNVGRPADLDVLGRMFPHGISVVPDDEVSEPGVMRWVASPEPANPPQPSVEPVSVWYRPDCGHDHLSDGNVSIVCPDGIAPRTEPMDPAFGPAFDETYRR